MSRSTTTVYVRWRPDELAIGILGQSPRVKEPPRVVVTDRGHLCAIGLEATEAVAKRAHSLIHFRSFRDVQRHPVVAATVLHYLAMMIWSEMRGSWWLAASGYLPWLRPSIVIHFADGAEEGLSAEATAPLVDELEARGIRRVFLWVGEELGAYALRGAPVRGDWIDRAPRRGSTHRGHGRSEARHASGGKRALSRGRSVVSPVAYQEHQQNLNAGVLGAIAFTLLQVWAGRVISYALVPAFACAVWAVVECARRIKLRRRSGARGPLSLAEMLSRARADLGNNYLVVGPLGALVLTAWGGTRAGEHGALTGAVGGVLYMACMILSERYPVELPTPSA